MRTLLISISLLVILALGGWGLFQYLRPVVTTTRAVEAPVVQAFYATGTIQPQREYPIKSATEGTLVEVRVDKGDRIKKDQPLAIVHDPKLTYTAASAKAQLDEAIQRADPKKSPVLLEYDSRKEGTQGLLETAQHEVKRISDIMQTGAGSQTDLDRALDRQRQVLIDLASIDAQRDAKKLELDREVDVAKAALDTAQWNLEQQTLKAPIDGVVLDRPTAVGTRVAVNDQVMRIADVSIANLVMRADVDEEDVHKVNVGQTVRMTLYAFENEGLTGKVTKIYDQADASRRTFEIEVAMDKLYDRLLPGMTGELAFIMAVKDSAVVVPSQAVQEGSIYVVRDGHLHKLPVQVGLRSIERTEILSGLENDDQVVISPINAMTENQSVRVTQMDPATAAGLNKPPPITQAFKGFN